MTTTPKCGGLNQPQLFILPVDLQFEQNSVGTSCGKENCQYYLRARILKWSDYPGLSGRPNLTAWILKSREPFPGKAREGHIAVEEWPERGSNAGFGERGPWTKECGWSLENGKGRKQILPEASRKKLSPSHTLILAHWDPTQITNLQNYKIITLYCF